MKYLLLLLLAAAAGTAPAAQTGAVVAIKDDAFVPAQITVNAGDTVTFVNRDDDAHTVTSTTNAFDSKGLDSNAQWRHTFAKAGVYQYFCELHPFMKGTIVVKAGQ